MLIGEIDGIEFAPEYPELIGKRVLVTGVSCPLGHEIVRGFADARVRLVAHFAAKSADSDALQAHIQRHSLDSQVIFGAAANHAKAVELIREAVHVFDGIDAVINLVSISDSQPDDGDIERRVSDLMALPCLATRVCANRMRTTLVPGSILNVLVTERDASSRDAVLASIARSVLTGFTRSEASEWAKHGIRINAIAPGMASCGPHSGLSSAPDVSTLAMHLACERGHQLSGLTFEAYAG